MTIYDMIAQTIWHLPPIKVAFKPLVTIQKLRMISIEITVYTHTHAQRERGERERERESKHALLGHCMH
jgi:hypothetical protein